MAVQLQKLLRLGTSSLLNITIICRLSLASLLLLPGITLASFTGVSLLTTTQESTQVVPLLSSIQEYEAEDASLSPKFRVTTNHPDFSGSGFVDYVGEGSVEWIVNADEGGKFLLSFRYALKSGDRPLDIVVNGSVVSRNTSFPATGSWDTWSSIETVVMLNPGANIVRARTRSSSGPNMDRLDASIVMPSTTQFMNN